MLELFFALGQRKTGISALPSGRDGVTLYECIETREAPLKSGFTRRFRKLGSRCVIAGAMCGPIAASQSGPPPRNVLPP